MSWFLRIADLNLQALGFSQGAQAYLMSLNNWDRGTAVELSKLTNEKGASRLEFHLNRYKEFLYEVQGKIPNRFLFPVYAWLNRGVIRLPEDLGRLTRALSVFTQQNSKFELKNIQQYPSLGDLEEAVSKVTGVNEESKRQVAKNVKMQGSKEVYRDNEWRVVEMTTPEAVCELGKGTKWCTNADNEGFENAKMYLEAGPLFLFLHNEGGKWQKYAQATKSLDQVMDVLDKKIINPSKSFMSLLKKLIELGVINDYDFFENYAKDIFYEGADIDFVKYFSKQLEETGGKFPKYAFEDIIDYAQNFGRLKHVEDYIIFTPIISDKESVKNGVINGDRIDYYIEAVSQRGIRWDNKAQEDFIAKTTYAFNYWRDRYSEYNFGENKPGNGDFQVWPEYERELLSNNYRATELVTYLWHLNGEKRAEKRFEDYFLTSASETRDFDACLAYAKNCNFRWRELESLIISSGNLLIMYDYAKEILRERWIEAEAYLLNNKWGGLIEAVYYARDVIKQRWPELEKRIIEVRNGYAAAMYAAEVMHERWPEMEPYIMSNSSSAPGLYENYFNIKKKSSNTNWYKRAQSYKVYDLENNYLNVGHSGFNKGEYGCNYLWFFYKNGSFEYTKETDLINDHGIWRFENELADNYVYKGRVDICNKEASLARCSDCFSSGMNPMSISKELFCEKLKYKCIDIIHQIFGTDIMIREF